PRDELALLPDRCQLTEPDRRLTTGLDHLLGQPLQLLPVASVERKRRQPVYHLRGTKAPQLPPQPTTRRRRLAREPVGEQHPESATRTHWPHYPQSLQQRLQKIPIAKDLPASDAPTPTTARRVSSAH